MLRTSSVSTRRSTQPDLLNLRTESRSQSCELPSISVTRKETMPADVCMARFPLRGIRQQQDDRPRVSRIATGGGYAAAASYQCIPCVSCANAICSALSLVSPSFLPAAAAESGNMLNAVLSRICVSFGAIAWETAPKTPSRVAMRTGLYTIASTMRSAASSGESVGTFSYILVGAIIGVRTSGMLIVVKSIPLSMNSDAAHAANESSADFDATYAENRGALDSTPIDEMLMMWPRLFATMLGTNPMMRRNAPK